MSKKVTPARKSTTAKSKVAASPAAPISSPVRYSAIPKSVAAAKPAVTAEMIARKAFELYAGGRPGGEVDHWLAAESELRTAA